MAKLCPVTNKKVPYLTCLECEDKVCQNEHVSVPTEYKVVLPCAPGSTMYRVAYRMDGKAYVCKVPDVSFEIFKDFVHVRDSEGVAYSLNREIFATEEEAAKAAELADKEEF